MLVLGLVKLRLREAPLPQTPYVALAIEKQVPTGTVTAPIITTSMVFFFNIAILSDSSGMPQRDASNSVVRQPST